MESQFTLLVLMAAIMFAVIGGLSLLSYHYTLGIKSKTVGDGQHGTARWATKKEIKKSYALVPFKPKDWRQGNNRPHVQGIIIGSKGSGKNLAALVDEGDVHCLMIGASGVGEDCVFSLS